MTLHLTPERADITAALADLGAGNPEQVLLAGDWHGNTATAKAAIEQAARHRISVIIQLGDFGLWPGTSGDWFLNQVSTAAVNAGVTVCWLDGNHEDFDQLESITPRPDGLRVLRPSIVHLPRGSRWTWQESRFAAVGGATSLDRPSRTTQVNWWPQESLEAFQTADIAAAGPVDVLLTHDVSHEINVPGIQHRVYTGRWGRHELEAAWTHRERLGDLTAALQPTHLFHGHFHEAYQKRQTLSFGTVSVTGLGADDNVSTNTTIVNVADLAAEVRELRELRSSITGKDGQPDS